MQTHIYTHTPLTHIKQTIPPFLLCGGRDYNTLTFCSYAFVHTVRGVQQRIASISARRPSYYSLFYYMYTCMVVGKKGDVNTTLKCKHAHSMCLYIYMYMYMCVCVRVDVKVTN